MKKLKNQIEKIIKNRSLEYEYLNHDLDNFLREVQKKFISKCIKKYNILNMEYSEYAINELISKYNLEDKNIIEEKIKGFFSKFDNSDKIKELLRKFYLNYSKYDKNKNQRIVHNGDIQKLKEIYADCLKNINKDIIFSKNVYSSFSGDYDKYKVVEFENDLKLLIELVYNRDDADNSFKATYYKNGKAKIKFNDEKFHKEIHLYLLENDFKRFKREFYIKLSDVNKQNKNIAHRFTIYKDSDDILYLRTKVNIFEYSKYEGLLKTYFDGLRCVFDFDLFYNNDKFEHDRTKRRIKEQSKEHQEQLNKFWGLFDSFNLKFE